MAKTTLALFFILALVATLLLGINIGKKIGFSQSDNNLQITPTLISPTATVQPPTPPYEFLPPSVTSTGSKTNSSSKVTFTDKRCGFSLSYPGNFLKSETNNNLSVVFTHPDDSTIALAATCSEKIPIPPVSVENQETITIQGQTATLYHDKYPDNSPRDEVIVQHPSNGMEIIIAGYGATFQNALNSIRFL